jgi:hypothetical protein
MVRYRDSAQTKSQSCAAIVVGLIGSWSRFGTAQSVRIGSIRGDLPSRI